MDVKNFKRLDQLNNLRDVDRGSLWKLLEKSKMKYFRPYDTYVFDILEMMDEEQNAGQRQNQGAMSRTPTRSPGMLSTRRSGGSPCTGKCIRKTKLCKLE